MNIFKLLASVLGRIVTAVSSPFRMLVIQAQRLLNINIITAKLIQPLTKNVRKLLRLRPTEKSDYVSVGRFLVFRQLFAFLVLAACAGVFVFFGMYAGKVKQAPVTLQHITTDVAFRYDDIAVKSFSGTANILSFDGKLVYTGEIVNGVCQGVGILYTRDGKLLYEGGFENNRYQGRGVKYSPDGIIEYEGDFADNLYEGSGKLYNARGVLIYDGMFRKGAYDALGKLYSDKGRLIYEGSFAGGMRHGLGAAYYEDGTTQYEGEFFEDAFQGRGTLYASSGKRIYTGAMYGGKINYRSLVGATLLDVETAFADTPKIYYQEDGGVCFFYEITGVVVTTDCRVKVYETERSKDDPAEGLYYLPGEEGYYLSQSGDEAVVYSEEPSRQAESSQTESLPPPSSSTEPQSQNDPDLPEDFTLLRSENPAISKLTAGGLPAPSPMAWVIIDPYNSSSSSSGNSSSSSSSGSSVPQSSDASSGGSSESESQSTAASSAAQPEFAELPDFVEKIKTLYFEIDTDVWQPEELLDKTKVFVKRVTVIGAEAPPGENATEIDENPAPSVEDCVAIENIRRKEPTAFPAISFQLDGRNKLFHRVWNINHASRIVRRTFLSGDLTLRFSYTDEAGTSIAYYSIES